MLIIEPLLTPSLFYRRRVADKSGVNQLKSNWNLICDLIVYCLAAKPFT